VRSHALRGCSRALLAGSKPVPASCSQVADGGCRWLLMTVRGHLGGPPVMGRPKSGPAVVLVRRPSPQRIIYTSVAIPGSPSRAKDRRYRGPPRMTRPGRRVWARCPRITPLSVVWRGTTGAAREHRPGYQPGTLRVQRVSPSASLKPSAGLSGRKYGRPPGGVLDGTVGWLRRGSCCRCRGADGPVVRCAVRQE